MNHDELKPLPLDYRGPDTTHAADRDVPSGCFALFSCGVIVLVALAALWWAILTVFWPDKLLGDRTFERYIAAACMVLFSAFLMLPAAAAFRTALRRFSKL